MIEQLYLKISEYFVAPVYADPLGQLITTNVTAVTQASDFESLIQAIIGVAIPLGGLGAVLLFVYAAYLMITSAGDPEKLAEAKEIVTNAVLGFAMIALSVGILLLIQDVINLPLT